MFREFGRKMNRKKNKGIRLKINLDSMVLAGIFVATLYIALDTILHIFFSDRFNLLALMVGPDMCEICIRIIVLCLFVFLAPMPSTRLIT